jgi:hypothetical protein
MATLVANAPEQAWATKHGHVDFGTHHGIALESLAARYEIEDLFARWGVAHDEGRMDVIASLFTADAEFRVVEGPDVKVRFQGRESIVAEIQRVFTFQNDQRRHCVTNVIIDNLVDGSADAVAFCICTVDGLKLAASVIYSAKCQVENGAFKFASLMIGLDSYAGVRPEDAIKGGKGLA